MGLILGILLPELETVHMKECQRNAEFFEDIPVLNGIALVLEVSTML